MIVYKYVPSNRVDVLKSNHIRFTQTSVLNDPFEATPSSVHYQAHQKIREAPGIYKQIKDLGGEPDIAEAILSDGIDRIGPESYRDFIDKTYVFLSLVKKSDNLLMWSHYADAHRGFVIGFDMESSFFDAGNGKTEHGLQSVTYSRHRYKMPLDGFPSLRPNELERAIATILFTKSKNWAYEKEFRILAHPKSADKTKPIHGNFDCCLFKFPPQCIQQIILGCRMRRTDRDKVLKAAKRYPNVKIFQAVLDDLEFKMRITPYDQPFHPAV